jgi:Iap family predicted aminopeptidase
MLAAHIWHWWIGVVLTVVSVAAAVALLVGYMKNVSSQRYPGGKHRPEADV